MLTQKTQQWPKSCGAAASLVTRVELGDVIRLTDANETAIYNQLKIPQGNLGAFEILPHSIATYMQNNHHHVAIIESQITATVLLGAHPGLGGMYALYNQGVQNSHFNKVMRDPNFNDLANGARMFLVVKFANADLTHYVLARRGDPPNQNTCYIMNPDPGTDEQINLPLVGTYFTTNARGLFGVGARRYKFLGIAILVS